jgi:hypothetical protein
VIRRPAALLLGVCLAVLAGPRLVSAAPPLKQPVVASTAPSPPAARSPAPVPAPAASTAVTAPILGRGSATPAAQGVPNARPATPASNPPGASAAAVPASAGRQPLEIPVGADLAVPGAARGDANGGAGGGSTGLPETTTLVLVALGMLAAGCAIGLTVLGRHAIVTAPDDAATLAAATRQRLQEAPMLPWDDPVLASMRLDRSHPGPATPGAAGGPRDGHAAAGPRRARVGWRQGPRS